MVWSPMVARQNERDTLQMHVPERTIKKPSLRARVCLLHFNCHFPFQCGLMCGTYRHIACWVVDENDGEVVIVFE